MLCRSLRIQPNTGRHAKPNRRSTDSECRRDKAGDSRAQLVRWPRRSCLWPDVGKHLLDRCQLALCRFRAGDRCGNEVGVRR